MNKVLTYLFETPTESIRKACYIRKPLRNDVCTVLVVQSLRKINDIQGRKDLLKDVIHRSFSLRNKRGEVGETDEYGSLYGVSL